MSGAGADDAFAEEAGGHRWQRVPPNDRKGRVQTSTITVAVLRESEVADLSLDPREIRWTATRGSGPGGQHRNKTCSAVDMVHLPTGLTVHCESERSLHQNLALARARLMMRITERRREAERAARDRDRKEQVGSGMRGDKRRTIRCQDGVVVDHPTGRTWALRAYLKGDY